MTKQTESVVPKIPPQELEKYNRESGKKTLYFVGALITLIVVLTIATLVLFKMSS